MKAEVIHTIGSINFLFDKSSEPYITVEQLNAYFGTNNSTVSNKARDIKKMLKLGYFNPEFSTQSMAASNPFNEMVIIDGFMVPLDTLPDDLQELVRETRAMGEDIEFTTR